MNYFRLYLKCVYNNKVIKKASKTANLFPQNLTFEEMEQLLQRQIQSCEDQRKAYENTINRLETQTKLYNEILNALLLSKEKYNEI